MKKKDNVEERFIYLVSKIMCLNKEISFNDYNILIRSSLKLSDDELGFDCFYGVNGGGDTIPLKRKDDSIIDDIPVFSGCIFYNYLYEILYISAELNDNNNIEK